MKITLAGMPATWRLTSTRGGVRYLDGPDGVRAEARATGWTIIHPLAKAGPSGTMSIPWHTTALAPWEGGLAEAEARRADYIAAQEARRVEQRIAAIELRRQATAAYLALVDGRARVEVDGTEDAWESDGEFGEAPGGFGTYGGSGWTLRVVAADGSELYRRREDRRKNLARWESVVARPGVTRLEVVGFPEYVGAYWDGGTYSATPVWNLPPGWRVERTRSMRTFLVRE